MTGIPFLGVYFGRCASSKEESRSHFRGAEQRRTISKFQCFTLSLAKWMSKRGPKMELNQKVRSMG